MSRTYALVGTRPDLAGSLAEAQLNALPRVKGDSTRWGIGWFEKDEVLLKKGRGTSDGLPSQLLPSQIHNVRSHAILIHESAESPDSLPLESSPPLRFGHFLFACAEPEGNYEPFAELVRAKLPDFLLRTTGGSGFAELAFALFLAQLPSGALTRSGMNGSTTPLGPLNIEALRRAVRVTLEVIDELTEKASVAAFKGDLWIHTGETLLVAHREGCFGLTVLRGRDDLIRWGGLSDPPPQSLDQSLYVTVTRTTSTLGPAWERIPEQTLLVASRGEVPRTEAL